MLRALLIDLDDTLLDNPMEPFVAAYLKAIAGIAAERVEPEALVRELLRATRAMDEDSGGGSTNQDAFAAVFYPALGLDPDEMAPVFARFYAERFPDLRRFTAQRREARPLLDWAFERGLQVAIATNPLFPATAIEQRLAWAGTPVEELPFDLVTTYENMHATKASPAYYEEILAVLGRNPEECLMVGDNWEWDVVQPARVGIPAFWIADPQAATPTGGARPVGQGRLGDLWARLRASVGEPLRSRIGAEGKGS